MLTANSKGGKQFPLIEAGLHEAVCYAIVDIGTVHSDAFNTDQRKVVFVWEIPDSRIEIDGKDLPRALSKHYTMSLGTKANLRKDLVSWRTRDFTPEEEENFELKSVLGAACLLNIIHKTKPDGAKYATINTVLNLKGKKFKPENPMVLYGIEENGLDIPSTLPPWLVEEIKKAPEYELILHPESVVPQGETDDIDPAVDDSDIPF